MLNEKFIYMSSINFSAASISKIFSRFPVSFARSRPPNATIGSKTKIHFRCKSNVSYAAPEENINPTEIAQINSN